MIKTKFTRLHTGSSVLPWVSCVSLAFFVSACVTEIPKVDPNFKEASAPTVRKTDYDDVLYNFGKMLQSYTGNTPVRPIYIQSKEIPNDTAGGGLPNNISQMVITTLNKIGGPLVYVPYDPVYLQNEINLGHGVVVRQNPDAVVTGAITEYDKDLAVQSDNQKISLSPPMGGKFQPDLSSNKGNRSDESRLAIDFSVLDYKTQTTISAPTSNTIAIKKSTRTGGFDFSVFGLGLGMEGSVTQSQGVHAAIRRLVEVSLVQLLGRAYRVPYWKLIPGATADARLTQTILDEFHGGSPEKLVEWILKAYGHFPGEYAGTSGMVDLLNKISRDLGKADSITSPASIPDDTLMAIYYNIPLKGYLAQHKAQQARKESGQVAQQAPVAETQKAPEKALNLSLDANKGSQSPYKLGEPVQLTVGTSGDAYVYCYWEQGNGTTIRIFPNRFHENAFVKSGQGFSIPDNNMPFSMKTEFPNSREKFGCFASATDVAGKLPANIIGEDLSEMNGVHMSAIAAAFASVGGSSLASKYLEISVR